MACCTEWTKSELLAFFGIKSIEHFYSGIQCCDEMRQFENVLVSTVFHVTVSCSFLGQFFTFSNSSLSLVQYSVNFLLLQLCKFFLCSPAFSAPLWTWIFLGRLFFVTLCGTSSFHSIWIYGSIKQLLTNYILHCVHLWIVYQLMPDPYTKLYLYLINAFIVLSLPMARANFVSHVSECRSFSFLILLDC